MRREETEGASLREGSAEVALEQWTERTAAVEAGVSVDFNAVSALTESGIGEKHKGRICCPVSEVSPVPAECREFP